MRYFLWITALNIFYFQNCFALSVCVLDGGGRTGALCGRKRYLQSVDSAYIDQSLDSLKIFSGFGESEIEDCTPFYFDISTCTDEIKQNCPVTQDALINSQQIRGKTEIISEKFTVPKSYAGNFQLESIANTDNFIQSCLPPKSTNGQKQDCHFWSSNHGSKDGITTKHFFKLVEPSDISTMIKNSNCKSTKFILNNCFSGIFHKIIYGQNGEVIPKEENNLIAKNCGVSATLADRPAVATTKSLSTTMITLTNGRSIQAQLHDVTYTFTDLMSKKLKSGSNLDDAFKFAFINDNTGEIPLSSGQYFLGLESLNEKIIEDIHDDNCLSKYLPGDMLVHSISELETQFSNIGENQDLKKDIENQKNHILDLENILCNNFYPDDCNHENFSEFIRNKYNLSITQVGRKNLHEINELRKKKLLLQSKIDEFYRKESLNENEQIEESRIQRELGNLSEKIFQLEQSPDIDLELIKPSSGFKNNAHKDNLITAFKKYRQLKRGLQKTLLMASDTNSKKIEDYLKIKRCEWSSFQNE